MSTEVKCPGCGHTFPIEEAMTEEYKKELREKMLSFTKQKEDEFQKKLEEFSTREQQQKQEFDKKLQQEKQALQLSLEENLRKTIAQDFQNKVEILETANKESAE